MGYAPENTLSSLRTALKMGVHGVEIDVYACGDRLIILHDENLDRTTNGVGPFAGKSIKELRLLDAGEGDRIPFLEEAIELVDRRAVVNIELKGEGVADLVAGQLSERIRNDGWRKEDFLVSSFSLPELHRFDGHATGVPCGVLGGRGTAEDALKSAIGMGSYSVHFDESSINERLIERAKREGLVVLAYTVNSPESAIYLEGLGLDGVFTDFPDLIIERKEKGA
jgi:glycerophosphoryl diester phosphodiesterase